MQDTCICLNILKILVKKYPASLYAAFKALSFKNAFYKLHDTVDSRCI